MGKAVELLNGIGSKDGDNIPISNGMAYKSPVRDYLSVDAEDNDFVPNKTWVKGVLAAAGIMPKVVITVTDPSSSFSYDSGITGSVPPNSGVYIVRSGVYQKFAEAFWDSATGIITTDVDAGADSYVLVVG